MKTKTLLSISTFIFTVVFISGCATTPKYISPGRFEQIEVGVTYRENRIAAESENYYRFTPQSSGVYTISVTGAESDLSWELHNNAKDAWLLEERSIIAARDGTGTADEIGRTPELNAGQEYYLIVLQWDKTSDYYELSIVPGRR